MMCYALRPYYAARCVRSIFDLQHRWCKATGITACVLRQVQRCLVLSALLMCNHYIPTVHAWFVDTIMLTAITI
jgi:hypothetical protein